jgi:integrase
VTRSESNGQFTKKGEYWYIRYRDETGKQTERKASRDKAVAKSMMAKLEDRLSGIKLGTLDAREADCIEAQQIPLSEHVEDFIRTLQGRGCVPEHVDGMSKRLTWLMEETKITRLSQIRLSLALDALKDFRDGRRSERTLGHYVAAWKGFTRWCKIDSRTKEDLLDELERPELPTSEGAALTPEQAGKLISATRSGKPRRGMSGEDRSWLYALAMYTGFRRGELQALRPEFFDLDGSTSTVTLKGNVAGQLTKNRKWAQQPLPSHIIPDLRAWLAKKQTGLLIVPQDRNSSLMIKADLKAAGIPAGEFTFHSLRHTYISLINATGADQKSTMELARHSDPRLTFGIYAHTRLEEKGRAVDSLPSLWERPINFPRGEGKCGKPLDLSHTLPTQGVSMGPNGTIAGPVKQSPRAPQYDPSRHAFELPGQDSSSLMSSENQDEKTHQRSLAHALPTSSTEDPDLALIVGVWGRLVDECKRKVIEIIHANLDIREVCDEADMAEKPGW